MDLLRHRPHLGKALGACADRRQQLQGGGRDQQPRCQAFGSTNTAAHRQAAGPRPAATWAHHTTSPPLPNITRPAAPTHPLTHPPTHPPTHLRQVGVGLAVHAQRGAPVRPELGQRAQLGGGRGWGGAAGVGQGGAAPAAASVDQAAGPERWHPQALVSSTPPAARHVSCRPRAPAHPPTLNAVRRLRSTLGTLRPVCAVRRRCRPGEQGLGGCPRPCHHATRWP